MSCFAPQPTLVQLPEPIPEPIPSAPPAAAPPPPSDDQTANISRAALCPPLAPILLPSDHDLVDTIYDLRTFAYEILAHHVWSEDKDKEFRDHDPTFDEPSVHTTGVLHPIMHDGIWLPYVLVDSTAADAPRELRPIRDSAALVLESLQAKLPSEYSNDCRQACNSHVPFNSLTCHFPVRPTTVQLLLRAAGSKSPAPPVQYDTISWMSKASASHSSLVLCFTTLQYSRVAGH